MANPGGDRVYTLPELAELSSIDYRTLHNWQKRGMLHPSHHSANGSGTVNLFTATDALHVLVLAELRRGGVEVRALEQIADRVRDLVASDTGERLLVISDGEAELHERRELDRGIRSDRPSVVLDVTAVHQRLRALPAAA